MKEHSFLVFFTLFLGFPDVRFYDTLTNDVYLEVDFEARAL